MIPWILVSKQRPKRGSNVLVRGVDEDGVKWYGIARFSGARFIDPRDCAPWSKPTHWALIDDPEDWR